MTDYRYKVTKQDILDMREFKELGFTNRELAEHFGVSQSTILYWTNDESRHKQRLKNSSRKSVKRTKRVIERNTAKRKLNIEETQMTFIRHKYHSRKADIKSRNKAFRTRDGIAKKVREKNMEKKKGSRTNGKRSR